MKIKTILFFAFFVFIVSCAPQVTVTPEATVTLPPVSTPTLHPDFIALQESIAASSGRFSLHADGQLYDGDTPIPGVIVMPDGKMVLTVDGDKEIVVLPNGYDFDDDEGFTVKGMEYDEETGAWVEVNETVTIGGVVMTLDENGVVTEMQATGKEEEQAEKLFPFDATNLGFAEGETVLMMLDDKLTIVDADDHSRIIAQWGMSDTTGRTEIIYDFSQMVDENGENVLLKVGFLEPMSGGVPKDKENAFERSKDLHDNFASQILIDIASKGNRGFHSSGVITPFDIFSQDRKNAVFGYLVAVDNKKDIPLSEIDRSEGVFVFKLSNGEFASVTVVNFEATLRGGKVK